jgi:RNA polymerase sigma factor (sigma-70 family)
MPKRLLDCLRRVVLLRDGGGLSDGQLLTLFVKHHDADAFAALLNRHAPMVMGVCRRVLRNQEDAEDAFQATFLVFARKARSVTAQDALAGWLYRVAYRTALQARARIVRRRAKEQQVNELPHPAIELDEGHEELLALLDKEIDRLPDKYRVPLVLCELEGHSRKETARMLGVPEGTLSWRLAQAKKRLAKKLSRHGLAISAAVMAPGTASAFLRASTVKAVMTAGTVPAEVLALTQGVMKTMSLTKLKLTVCAGTLMLLAGVGASGLTYRATAQYRAPAPSLKLASRPQADELEALRLEIEALRKELRATKERVKALEDEQKRRSERRLDGTDGLRRDAENIGWENLALGILLRKSEKADNPLTRAEEALKKLRTNPGDKQATEELERALKQLKEREKATPPASSSPGQPK